MTVKVITQFNELNLHPTLLGALEKLNFTVPTPIQALSLGSSLEGKDVQGEASTGTGKTLAYLLPLINASLTQRSFQALVLVPTRELVTQVGDVVESFRKMGIPMEWIGLNGGTSIVPQLRRLRRPMQIYVGTPGRIFDHLGRGSLQLDNLQAFVLDEADRMLDMGFAPQIKKIQSFFPQEKPQTLFFSATYPEAVKKLVNSLLKNPVVVRAVSKDILKPDIDQDAFFVEPKEKFPTLVKQLQKREGSVLVFSQTKHATEKLAQRLLDESLDVGRIHGGLNQGQRNRTLKDFRNGQIRILIATDVAARGLDVEHVNHVINYDVPQQAEDYIHRIGRTGRAGRKGEAISFVTNDDRQVWREIRMIVKKQLEVELPELFVAKRNDYIKPEANSHSARPQSRFSQPRDSSSRYSQPRDASSKFSRPRDSESRPSRSYGERSFATKAPYASKETSFAPREQYAPRDQGPRKSFGMNDSASPRPARSSNTFSAPRPRTTDRADRPFRPDGFKARDGASSAPSTEFKPKKKYGPSNKKRFGSNDESKPSGFGFKAKRV